MVKAIRRASSKRAIAVDERPGNPSGDAMAAAVCSFASMLRKREATFANKKYQSIASLANLQTEIQRAVKVLSALPLRLRKLASLANASCCG